MWRLEFSDDITTFTAAIGRGVMPSSSGKLAEETSNEPAATLADGTVAGTTPESPVVARLLGTGPWTITGTAGGVSLFHEATIFMLDV